MNVATMIKAAHPIMACYVSYFDNKYDAAFALGRDEEIKRYKHEYDSFEAVYNRLVGAAALIDNVRILDGEESHGIVCTMLDIFYSYINW